MRGVARVRWRHRQAAAQWDGGVRRRCGQGGGGQRLPRRHQQTSQHIPRALRLLPRHLLGRPQVPVSTRRREAPRPLLCTSAILHLRLIPTAVEPPLALHRPVSNHPPGSLLLSAAAACRLRRRRREWGSLARRRRPPPRARRRCTAARDVNLWRETRFAGHMRGFSSEGYIDGKNDHRIDNLPPVLHRQRQEGVRLHGARARLRCHGKGTNRYGSKQMAAPVT